MEGDDDIGEEKGRWRQRLWGYFPSCEVASSLSWRLGMFCYWKGITTALRRPMWTNTLAVGKHSGEKPARKSKICSEIVSNGILPPIPGAKSPPSSTLLNDSFYSHTFEYGFPLPASDADLGALSHTAGKERERERNEERAKA